jgi:hypothetical protein
MRRASVGVVAVVLAVLVACGGGGSGGSGGKPATLADWNARHGAAVAGLGTALDKVADATKAGEPVGIRTSCAALRESVTEVKATLPVPDAKADADLRSALDAITGGVTDCLGAMAVGDARQLERAITQLRDGRLKLDTANAALSA